MVSFFSQINFKRYEDPVKQLKIVVPNPNPSLWKINVKSKMEKKSQELQQDSNVVEEERMVAVSCLCPVSRP